MRPTRFDLEHAEIDDLLNAGRELAAVGTWVSYDGADGERRIAWSEECDEMLGTAVPGRDAPLESLLTFVQEEDAQLIKVIFDGRAAEGPLSEFEFRIRRADGSSRHLAIRATALEGRRTLGLVQDVSHWRAAEEKERLADRGLRALFESSRDGLTLFDDNGTYLDVNDRFCEILGRPREDFVGRRVGSTDWSSLVMGESRWRELTRGRIHRSEITVYRPDGSTCDAETLALPNFYPGIHLSIIRDVTEQRRDSAALREAEARYRSLVEDLPLVTYILGARRDGRPTYASPRAEALLGYPVEEWTQRPDFQRELIHPDDRAAAALELDAWTEAQPLDREYRVIASNGETLWVLDRMVAVHDEAGSLVCYQGFLLDVTRRKQLEEQLHQAQRMDTIGRLAGGIAHDFNNLLTAIMGYSDFALERIGDNNERLRSDVDQISKAAERAAALTQQLLAFSRRQVLQPRTLDLNAVVGDVRTLLERLIGEQIELVTTAAETPVLVNADPGRLEQVLVNLAVNARDAMAAGGKLTIAVCETELEDGQGIGDWGAEPGRYPTLVVSDTGHGIDPDTLEHVFEPFFTTKGVGLGTGLGLSTVEGIVKQSGGWITLESKEGEGTTARIFMPRTSAPVETPIETPAEPAAATGTILLVEDEAVVRVLVSQMLEQRGYDVIEAEGPLEALYLADHGELDLLVTDVVMPKMNGRELARQLRGKMASLHVVYMSGYAPEEVLDGGRLDPGEFFLQKPFTAPELGAIVHDALDAAATPSA